MAQGAVVFAAVPASSRKRLLSASTSRRLEPAGEPTSFGDHGALGRHPRLGAVVQPLPDHRCGRSRRSRRLPSGRTGARSRCRAATLPRTARRRGCCARRPSSVLGAGRGRDQILGADRRRVGRARSIWLGVVMCASKIAIATGPGPGGPPRCRRGRPVTSRSLSARTLFAAAASLAASSPLIGICAAIPPIAWMPRLWQVCTTRLGVGRHVGLGHGHVGLRSGRTRSGWARKRLDVARRCSPNDRS
jgi:hypothetical protein